LFYIEFVTAARGDKRGGQVAFGGEKSGRAYHIDKLRAFFEFRFHIFRSKSFACRGKCVFAFLFFQKIVKSRVHIMRQFNIMFRTGPPSIIASRVSAATAPSSCAGCNTICIPGQSTGSILAQSNPVKAKFSS